MSQEQQNQKALFLIKLKFILLDFHSLDNPLNLRCPAGRHTVLLSVLVSDPLNA
jgi:hypothetical protein